MRPSYPIEIFQLVQLDVDDDIVSRCEPWIRRVSAGLREVR